ncbi:MFS transporter [Cellulomonas soli]|uniref:MFS transporter n=2 Tax=Cellulomonas soli TaxID=931535 RepID=A0A512P8K5_9CELL|nr:MFS transporter [Cellulomonas soli]
MALTTVAVDVLVIDVLKASEAQVGLVRASQFLPYLVLGLVAGAQVDRWRRRRVLIGFNLAQALLLLGIPLLYAAGALSVTSTAVVLFASGCCAVYVAAAEQAYLPDLVPRRTLVLANARLGQAMSVAQTLGPAVAGFLVAAVSAPVTLVVSSLARGFNAMSIFRIRRPEPPRDVERRPIVREIGEGLSFTYRHQTLAPLAVSTHVWFLANSIAVTLLGLFVLRDLSLSAAAYGAVLTAAGVGSLLGALAAPRAARRLGEGNVIIVSRAACALAWAAIAFTPTAAATSVIIGYLGVLQLLCGASMGLEDPSEMGYRQAVTPRVMLGRVNSVLRSANRSMAVVGALVGGVLATAFSFRTTLLAVAALFLTAALVGAGSPLRGARSGRVPVAP